MKNNLLKVNAMKKFARWLDTNRVHIELWDMYNPMGKIYEGLERRQQRADDRDRFCRIRSRQRISWKDTYSRLGQFIKAELLLKYIKHRYKR